MLHAKIIRNSTPLQIYELRIIRFGDAGSCNVNRLRRDANYAYTSYALIGT